MYYTEDTILYYNGAFVCAAAATGNLFDQSLHYGYGVFEGLRSYATEDGVKIFKAKAHFERMRFSCTAIGIPFPFDIDELIAISYEVLEHNQFKDAYIRPLITCPPNMALTKGRGAQLLIAAWEWGAYLGHQLLRLKTASYRRISPKNFIVEAKVSGHYVNSILASQEAKDLGYDEALLLDLDGFVAEGPGANIFMEKDHRLYTPKTGSILPGITRATVLEICLDLGIEVVEKHITLEEIYTADSAFFCGTAAEIIGIASLDDRAFPKPWPQTIGHTIQQAYKSLVVAKDFTHLECIA